MLLNFDMAFQFQIILASPNKLIKMILHFGLIQARFDSISTSQNWELTLMIQPS